MRETNTFNVFDKHIFRNQISIHKHDLSNHVLMLNYITLIPYNVKKNVETFINLDVVVTIHVLFLILLMVFHSIHTNL